jgi:hypothetical protein
MLPYDQLLAAVTCGLLVFFLALRHLAREEDDAEE